MGEKSKDNYPNAGANYATASENKSKRQSAAADTTMESTEATTTPVAAGQATGEPALKKQRVEAPSQSAEKQASGQTEEERLQHQQWEQKQEQKQREGKKTSKKKLKTKHMDPRILKVRKIIQEGCRTNDLASAMDAYENAIKEGIRIEAQSYYNLLNLCDGLDRDERKVHVGTPKVPKDYKQKENNENPRSEQAPTKKAFVDSKKRQEYVFAIKQKMQSKEVNLPLNETAYSAIVKILSKNKEFEKAEEILREAETVQQCKPKLRLYASLLHAYCEDNQLVHALRCWKRLRQRAVALQKERKEKNPEQATASAYSNDGMDVTEREYLVLLQCAVRMGRNDGSDLVFEDVLTRLAEDIPVAAKDSVSAITDWFKLQNNISNDKSTVETNEERQRIQEMLETIRNHDAIPEPSPRMGPVMCKQTWTISPACSIDRKTGVLLDGCLEGQKLHQVPLSDGSFRDMMVMNESIVQIGNIKGNSHSKFQGGRKGKKRTDFSPEARKAEWEKFNNFLEKQVAKNDTNQPYEVVVDGANIGFFKQNFANAPRHVDYEQIDWVVRHFTKLGKKVLLVMHNRHFNRHMLPPKYQCLCDTWINEGILYKTPPGMNDDWFWMHAALKYKTLVITNDEMRDHHFQMLAPKFFLRWKERHQAHFDFGDVHMEQPRGISGRRPRQVLLTYPEVYSRRIQRVADGLVVPLSKRGDENRFLDGCHIASDDEPEKELYLCVRPTHK